MVLLDSLRCSKGTQLSFLGKVRSLLVGVADDYEPERLYVIRIDNWFGPKWMHFAGKISVGKHFYAGIHKVTLHVPPFVPHRVVAERVFAGPDYDDTLRSRSIAKPRLAGIAKEQRLQFAVSPKPVHARMVGGCSNYSTTALRECEALPYTAWVF